jgi:ELWxxDGT repeat protein
MAKAVFAGYDASGHYNLWVTDGTPTGTSELLPVGADPSGLISNGYPDFTVLGRTVLFNASDSHSLGSMWVTDGVTSGTSALTISPLNDLFQFDFPEPDFTVLGTDAVFEANAAGLASLWVTNGTSAGTTGLAHPGDRRLQQRRQVRHPVAELERRRRHLGDERHEYPRRRHDRQPRPHLARLTRVGAKNTQAADGPSYLIKLKA